MRRFVAQLFGKEPLGDIDPDQVVALGAAVQADLLTNRDRADEVLLLDVIPLSLGLETMGGVVEKLVPRNSAIPTTAAQVFTTFQDGQNALDVHVVQGERELVTDNRSLARFRLSGIPPLPAGMARVEVRFEVNADGILSVSAKELSTGVSQAITVKPTHGLTDEEIEQMLLDSIEHAEDGHPGASAPRAADRGGANPSRRAEAAGRVLRPPARRTSAAGGGGHRPGGRAAGDGHRLAARWPTRSRRWTRCPGRSWSGS